MVYHVDDWFRMRRSSNTRPKQMVLLQIIQSQEVNLLVSDVNKSSALLRFGEEARALYNKVVWMTIVLWTLYPVVWIIAEGQRMLSASMEGNYKARLKTSFAGQRKNILWAIFTDRTSVCMYEFIFSAYKITFYTRFDDSKYIKTSFVGQRKNILWVSFTF